MHVQQDLEPQLQEHQHQASSSRASHPAVVTAPSSPNASVGLCALVRERLLAKRASQAAHVPQDGLLIFALAVALHAAAARYKNRISIPCSSEVMSAEGLALHSGASLCLGPIGELQSSRDTELAINQTNQGTKRGCNNRLAVI